MNRFPTHPMLTMLRLLMAIAVFSLLQQDKPVVAQTALTGGKGILRLYEAETVTPGRLYFNTFFSYFAVEMADANALAKDITLQVGVTCAFNRRVEAFLHVVPVQTDQQHLWGPPGDTRLGVKFNLLRHGRRQAALAATVDFPTACVHPIPFEPFSDGAFGHTLFAIGSLDLRRVFGSPLKAAVNLGYRTHDAGRPLFSGKTDQLVGGAGLKWLFKSTLFYSEVTGELFIRQPAVTLRQNSLRFSQGVKFPGRGGLIFDAAVDVELGRYRPAPTETTAQPRWWADYADWKLIFGVTYRAEVLRGLDEQRRLEKIQRREEKNNLEQIREKRQKVSKELEELKRRLEEEKKEGVPF